jgi:hypothetical protein
MRPKSFFINGGAGRVLCSIPALEKYQEDHPDEDFVIVCEGGTDFFKGHPTLYSHVYDNWHKNLFRDKIVNTDIETPEPYRIWEYYNQKCNLSQAFDIAINKKGIRELQKPTIKLSREEQISGLISVNEVREKTKKEKTVVFQPFGRGVQVIGNLIIDSSGRSFEYASVINIVKKLQRKYSVILMTDILLNIDSENMKEPVAIPQGIPIRHWAGIIKEADLFIGCDSVGQHIAYSVDTPAVVVVGSTFKENISYPNYEKFDILDMGDGLRVYDPIRVSYDEESLRMNDGVMVMNDKIEDVIIKSSDKLMNKYYQKPTIKFNLPTQEQSNSSCCPPTMTGNSNPTMTGNSNPNLIPALLENTKGSNNILESIGKNKTSGFANSTNIKK